MSQETIQSVHGLRLSTAELSSLYLSAGVTGRLLLA